MNMKFLKNKSEIKQIEVTDAISKVNLLNLDNQYGLFINNRHPLRATDVLNLKNITKAELSKLSELFNFELIEFDSVIDGNDVRVKDIYFTGKQSAKQFIEYIMESD